MKRQKKINNQFTAHYNSSLKLPLCLKMTKKALFDYLETKQDNELGHYTVNLKTINLDKLKESYTYKMQFNNDEKKKIELFFMSCDMLEIFNNAKKDYEQLQLIKENK